MNKGVYVAAGIAAFLVARKFFTVEEPNYFEPEKEDTAPPRPYTPPPPTDNPPNIAYTPPSSSRKYYGHLNWGYTKPPGYPENGRTVNKRGDGRELILQVCRDKGYDPIFAQGMLQLAQHESGTTIALPSMPFDVRPQAERPAGKAYVSAWGVFSFNNPAWRDLKRRLPWIPNYNVGPCSVIDIKTALVWECTPYEEVYFPLVRYSQIYNYAISNGFTPHDAIVITTVSHGGGGMAADLLSKGPNGWKAYANSLPSSRMKNWLFNECIPMADRAIAAAS